jgi:putative SOS response-associated peptidase YedK
MCNRYSSTKNEVSLTLRKAVHQFLLAMRPNIAPTQKAPVVLMENDAPVMRDYVWGWRSANGPVMNARAETAAFKMFKDALRSRHCLVPADGFYEWKTMSDGKQPYRFARKDDALFWFAGLWQEEQFTILTAPASGCVADLHDRMPVILKENDLEWWLFDSGNCDGKEIISRAASPEELHCYPVTRAMNNSRYTLPDCVQKISVEEKQLGFSL